MSRYHVLKSVVRPLLFILLAIQVAGCNFPAASVDAVPTKTLEPANTSIPASTSAPRPTNTSTPAPTPVPAQLVWYAPNMGSTDYPELFTKPEQWSVAREKINVFKFYTQNLLDDPCTICGDNILHTFARVDAFRKLPDWGIAIGAEVGAVKPWGCTSDITFRVAQL